MYQISPWAKHVMSVSLDGLKLLPSEDLRLGLAWKMLIVLVLGESIDPTSKDQI